QNYYSSANARPADVLVFYKNDWKRKRDVKEMAGALAIFVRNNYPSGAEDCVTLQSLSRGVRGWVDGLSVVRILRAEGMWQAGGVGDIERITYEELAKRIAVKDLLLREYRRRRPGWQM